MKIAIIGANGQLGVDIVSSFRDTGTEVVELSEECADISQADQIASRLSELGPEMVINSAAYNDLPGCEERPEIAFAVNAEGAGNVALACMEIGAALCHISTDYVFDGEKGEPYLEADEPNPLSIYAKSKLAGENLVKSIVDRHFIVRVSAIYGRSPCITKGGLNFVRMMLKLAEDRGEVRVVDDEFISPTTTVAIARQLVMLLGRENYGTYHATCEGGCSWYDFAREIFHLTGTEVRLSKANPDEFAGKVRRPKYSVLENAELKALGINIMPHWKEGLKEYLESVR